MDIGQSELDWRQHVIGTPCDRIGDHFGDRIARSCGHVYRLNARRYIEFPDPQVRCRCPYQWSQTLAYPASPSPPQ